MQEHEGFSADIASYLKANAPNRPDAHKEPGSAFELGYKVELLKERLARAFFIENKATGAMELFGPLLYRNPPQIRLLASILNAMKAGGPVRIIILKSRKLGCSTLIDLIGLDLIMQLPGWVAGLISHTDDSKHKLFNSVRSCVEYIPPVYQIPVRYNSEDRIVFGEDNKQKRKAHIFGHQAAFHSATAAGNYILTGETIRFLHLSECAKYDSVGDFEAQQSFILSSLGAVPKNGPSVVIAESTANGMQGWFYRTWVQATTKDPDNIGATWIPIFISWLDDPTCRITVPRAYRWTAWDTDDKKTEDMLREKGAADEQLYFRRHVIATEMSYNPDLFDQEFPTTPETSFLASGRPAIPRNALRNAEINVSDNFTEYAAFIREQPTPGTTYTVVGNEDE